MGVLHPWVAMARLFKVEKTRLDGNRPGVARCATSDVTCGIGVGVEGQGVDELCWKCEGLRG